ncbi:MAG: NAD(P)H-hydrate dehydratase, partial [Flavisolibacter sp.]
MNILSAVQMQAWDQYTIQNEPVSSIDLMERAAQKCVDWIQSKFTVDNHFLVFCGKGNNGGDGLAIARILLNNGYPVSIYIPGDNNNGSEDFQVNYSRLLEKTKDIFLITAKANFPPISSKHIVIDALFGTGINKPLDALAAELVQYINESKSKVLSIDLPSGLMPDEFTNGAVVQATHTLTFQAYKKALLVQDNAAFTGEVHVLDICLHPGFLEENKQQQFFINEQLVRDIFKPRKPYAHKGHFGHALLVAGSHGKMGAALLAARSCIQSGVGLLTCYIPSCGYEIMQAGIPEAMVITDENEKFLTQLPAGIENYKSIGIGPGIGTTDETQKLMSFLIRRYQKPLVIDADGLNCLALQNALLQQLPQGSILTPHPKEFDRMFGMHDTDFARMDTAEAKAKEWNIVIILKGHHSFIATPGGQVYYNGT